MLVRGFGSGAMGRLTDDEGNHGGSISSGGFEALDELLDLPDLNLSRDYSSVAVENLGLNGGVNC
jgi:hypothetical protein